MRNRRWIPSLLFLAMGGGVLVAPPVAEAAADGRHSTEAATAEETALCSVCRVHEGETEEEPIRASAEFQEKTYGFCSEVCRERFLEAPQAYVDPVFPRPAPAFLAQGLEGQELSSEDLKGKVTLLDFWATWCLPCVTDLPKLTALHQRYEGQGFQVLGVSIDEGKRAARKVERMVRKKNVEHPVYLDGEEDSAWGAFWVRAIPAQFLIDQQGQIVAQWSGVIDLAGSRVRGGESPRRGLRTITPSARLSLSGLSKTIPLAYPQHS